jgi:hypothetical protein
MDQWQPVAHTLRNAEVNDTLGLSQLTVSISHSQPTPPLRISKHPNAELGGKVCSCGALGRQGCHSKTP